MLRLVQVRWLSNTSLSIFKLTFEIPSSSTPEVPPSISESLSKVGNFLGFAKALGMGDLAAGLLLIGEDLPKKWASKPLDD